MFNLIKNKIKKLFGFINILNDIDKEKYTGEEIYVIENFFKLFNDRFNGDFIDKEKLSDAVNSALHALLDDVNKKYYYRNWEKEKVERENYHYNLAKFNEFEKREKYADSIGYWKTETDPAGCFGNGAIKTLPSADGITYYYDPVFYVQYNFNCNEFIIAKKKSKGEPYLIDRINIKNYYE